MSNIHYLFPTVIFYKENILDKKELIKIKKFSKEILNKNNSGGNNWLSKIKNSHDKYDICKDKRFNPLISNITTEVNNFNKEHNSKYEYKNASFGWLNLYKYNDHQEYHTHNGYRYSIIYCIEGEKEKDKSTQVSFKNPYVDMLPPKNISNHNELTYEYVSFKPVENSLLIFRSHLMHYVHNHLNKKQRITLALNYE